MNIFKKFFGGEKDKTKSNLTDEENEIFIKNQSKIPRDKEVILKIKSRYFKIRELG
jgi:hypothetical protein